MVNLSFHTETMLDAQIASDKELSKQALDALLDTVAKSETKKWDDAANAELAYHAGETETAVLFAQHLMFLNDPEKKPLDVVRALLVKAIVERTHRHSRNALLHIETAIKLCDKCELEQGVKMKLLYTKLVTQIQSHYEPLPKVKATLDALLALCTDETAQEKKELAIIAYVPYALKHKQPAEAQFYLSTIQSENIDKALRGQFMTLSRQVSSHLTATQQGWGILKPVAVAGGALAAGSASALASKWMKPRL